MGNITTDFITATKKIHADVRAILTALHLIGNDVKLIREHSVDNANKPTANAQAQNSKQEPAETVSSLNTSKSEGDKNKRKEYANGSFHRFLQRWRNNLKKPKFQITILTFVVILVYTCETRRTNDLTKQALNTGARQFRLQQRPYISVMSFKMWDAICGGKPKDETQGFDVGKPLVVNITYKNIGKTTAINLISHRHILFGKGLEHFKVEPADEPIQGGSIDAGEERTITAVSMTDTYRQETIVIDLADVVNWDGSEPVIVFGRISYTDTDGVLYCTPYGARRIPGNWLLLSTVMINNITTAPVSVLCPKGER
jgi:hypothetical protein